MLHRAALLLVALSGCTPTTHPSTGVNDSSPSPPSAPAEGTPAQRPKQAPKVLTADMPLQEGHVVFEGMVQGTKGGFEVRGVIIDDHVLEGALGPPGADGTRRELLGSVLRVEGELTKHTAPAEQDTDLPEQRRTGTWFSASRIGSAKVVKAAEVIEGTLARSKGFYTVAGRLVSQDDFDRYLGRKESKPSDRARLYGQPRTVVCEPNAQCLIEGSLPLFDVARAEWLP